MPSPAVTRANNIAAKIDPLIDWMLKNKPERKEIHMFKDDLAWLKKGDPAARTKGFTVVDGKVMYRSFLLLPYEP